ncbi:protein starmaker-like [Cydia amplana]|uniref:protein starmaker-like n=1 Tax=Cydia amplana TaxID=1869771 RepID=UPI002FE51492
MRGAGYNRMLRDHRHHCGWHSRVKMRLLKCCLVIFCVLIVHCFALNCRSDGGPKENELKRIYMNCLRRNEGRNASDSRHSDQDWRESRKKNQNHWDMRDDHSSKEDRIGSRVDRHDHDRDDDGSYDRGRNDRMGSRDRMGNRDRMDSDERSSGRHYQSDGRNDRMGGRGDRMDGQNDRNGRDEWMGRDDRYRRDDMINGREDFHSQEYGNDRFNPYRATQNPQRYRRERPSKNSGYRSQYNPNSSRPGDGNDERNSSENNSSRDSGCVLHCFLEELEMTGDNGMPDRYLVTHAITKDVKNEDLKDFLQESIDECFQILYNENTDDKCDFSKNLMTCLSEKGRANCDDWKDDFKIKY